MSIFERYPDLLDRAFIEGYDFSRCPTALDPEGMINDLDVAVAMIRTEVNYTEMSQLLKRSRRVLETYVLRDTDLKETEVDMQESFLDEIEAKYKTTARGGDPQAQRYFLDTLGKNRGYSKRIEATGRGGKDLGPTVVQFVGADSEHLEEETVESSR